MKMRQNLMTGLLAGISLLFISTSSQAGIFSFQIGYGGYSHHHAPHSSYYGHGYYYRPITHYYGYSPYSYYGGHGYYKPYGHHYSYINHHGTSHHNYGHNRHASKFTPHRRQH